MPHPPELLRMIKATVNSVNQTELLNPEAGVIGWDRLRYFIVGDKVEEIEASYSFEFITFCVTSWKLTFCQVTDRETERGRDFYPSCHCSTPTVFILNVTCSGLNFCIWLHSSAITPYLCAQQLRVHLSEWMGSINLSQPRLVDSVLTHVTVIHPFY